MQLDFISSPVLSCVSRAASDLVRVMKNPSISTFSTACNVIHYAKMPSHQSPRRNKASRLKADFKEPTCRCVMLPTPCCLMFILRFCSGLLSEFHVGLRNVLGCNLACAVDGLDFCSPSFLDVRHCYKIARQCSWTAALLAGKKTNLAFISCLVVCRVS
jgi:hypothetical protein